VADILQIAFFGAANSGKSTLVNALAGQEVSLVSPLPGTTTDPVRKRIELPGLGPCVLVDTAGYDDRSPLGEERRRLTERVIDSTDIAVLLRSGHPEDDRWAEMLRKADVPVVEIPSGGSVDGDSLALLLSRLQSARPDAEERSLLGSLVKPGDTVVLVMPQDSEAPKGRLILPQVQIIRALLDAGCIPVCCQPSGLQAALDGLRKLPDLVITDSQVFKAVDAAIPSECPLTSFSVLLAAAKGDIRVFVEGARAIDRLRPGDRVLIAEACSHVPDTEDIGRVKIPALLRRRVSPLQIDIAAGNDFPEDLSAYSLIIHCGACVATASLVRARTRKALLAGVPITNYGLAIAHLQGILSRISLP
jgi:predicted GTPase